MHETMHEEIHETEDPRAWPAAAPAGAARLHALARDALEAATRPDADRSDDALRRAFAAMLREGDGTALAEAFATTPGAAIHRHLWRALVDAEALPADDAVAVTVFALPLVIVAGTVDDATETPTLPGVLADAPALAAMLREHGALAGNQTFALANALAAPDALELARLPDLLRAHALGHARDATQVRLDLPPAPVAVSAGHETVHLRFVVGVALAAPGVDLLASRDPGKWGLPLARLIGTQLAAPGASVLALPHAPQRLVVALQTGRALQREVSAQVFLSNALRRMRGGVGEPSAVISAHRVADAPSGGELRLSLSSPFAPRDAEGFRCPLYAADRIAEVVQMLATLLADCRVTDVRVLPGVHADRDATTGVPLMFRADALH